MPRSVLVSGAGIAGATLGFWLGRAGFDVTVVERATEQRSSGSPVDVRGAAVDVAEKMGVMPRLREAATGAQRLVFVGAGGAPAATVRLSAFQGSAGDRELEIGRAELAAALLDAMREHARVRFGDSIAALAPDPGGVDVTFSGGSAGRFDLVVGADGLHSTVRRLVFGPESQFVRHLGMYVATLPLAAYGGDDRDVVLYNTPGRVVGTHPAGGVVFMFRHAAVAGFSARDLPLHKQLVTAEFTGNSGVFADAVDQVRKAGDLYCDAVSRVRLPQWSQGPVTLVGDAASCVSLFGDGSSNAMVGAHTLAEELTTTPDDPAAALLRYERRHRRVVERKQRGVRAAKAFLVPATSAGIAVRNTALRLLPG
ncbi:FAD-dependent monooxygenase [Nocardia brevicatena]|uniref:FAD-dependent monooxygenase n=1 Tax=Nocardia brevicatena TaxID=37327 RepID=UPI001C3F201C|nr:FAD-dependent monooxygenase [Nocardia brevicatena]